MKIIIWLSGSTTILALLHLIPLVLGVVGSIFWVMAWYHNKRKAKIEERTALLNDQIAELQLKQLQGRFSVNIVQSVTGSCQHD